MLLLLGSGNRGEGERERKRMNQAEWKSELLFPQARCVARISSLLPLLICRVLLLSLSSRFVMVEVSQIANSLIVVLGVFVLQSSLNSQRQQQRLVFFNSLSAQASFFIHTNSQKFFIP